MRVLIDTSFAARGRSGTGVYLDRLVTALRDRGEVEVVEARQRLRLRPGQAGRRRNLARSAANALLDAAWVGVGLPLAARRARANVIHHPLPARSLGARCAQVVTVHDVAFERHPDWYDPAWRRIARRQHRRAVRSADAIVCISDHTARDAQALLGAPADRIVVALHGPGQRLPQVQPIRPAEHFLYVGSSEPRKNVEGLLHAYAQYRAAEQEPLALVLCGESARRAGAPGVTGEPDAVPARLAELFAGAAALAHPAPLEGFGLTLLEAMAAATPVLGVRSAIAEEVCGEAALLVEAGELTDGLARLHHDEALRERLARAGAERAAAFSWESSAQRHELAYELAVERRASTRRP